MGRGGLDAQDEVHPGHIRLHFFRQLHGTQVGQTHEGFAFAHSQENCLHHQIFNRQGHEPDGQGLFAADVGGDHAGHLLGIDHPVHFQPDDFADFTEIVAAQPGIQLRGAVHGEISQSGAGEEPS